jgi:hypothetical protein
MRGTLKKAVVTTNGIVVTMDIAAEDADVRAIQAVLEKVVDIRMTDNQTEAFEEVKG